MPLTAAQNAKFDVEKVQNTAPPACVVALVYACSGSDHPHTDTRFWRERIMEEKRAVEGVMGTSHTSRIKRHTTHVVHHTSPVSSTCDALQGGWSTMYQQASMFITKARCRMG